MLEKVILIGGGLGPSAGLTLHRHIIDHTLTNGTDQSHLNLLHLSLPALVTDRFNALMEGKPEIPAFQMADLFAQIYQAFSGNQTKALCSVACNTFHIKPILEPFQARLQAHSPHLHFYSLIDSTINFIKAQHSNLNTIGILCSTLTRQFRLFDTPLEEAGLTPLHVPSEDQEKVQQSIYNPSWGLKGVSPVTPQAHQQIIELAQDLIKKGAQAIIMGCTEIPLVFPNMSDFQGVPLIDPMLATARILIQKTDSENKLKAYPL